VPSSQRHTISLRLPTREEEERRLRFQVLRNYLVGIDGFLHDTYGDEILTDLLAAQRALPGYSRIQRRVPTNPDQVRRCLTLSWAAELQLRLASTSYLCYSNAWAPVHSYYAVCMALNAWHAASLLNPPGDHSGTLNTISSKITQTSILPLPWSVTCSGCPPFDCQFPGLPNDADPNAPFELLRDPQPSDFWPRYCKLLKKTREYQLERVYNDWRRSNRRTRMRQDEKRQVASSQLPVTVFHYLYRLRLRANYRDVETMLMSPVDAAWHVKFYQGLLALTESSCLLIESLVIRSAGPQVYNATMNDFLQQTPSTTPDPRQFLERRRNLLLP